MVVLHRLLAPEPVLLSRRGLAARRLGRAPFVRRPRLPQQRRPSPCHAVRPGDPARAGHAAEPHQRLVVARRSQPVARTGADDRGHPCSIPRHGAATSPVYRAEQVDARDLPTGSGSPDGQRAGPPSRRRRRGRGRRRPPRSRGASRTAAAARRRRAGITGAAIGCRAWSPQRAYGAERARRRAVRRGGRAEERQRCIEHGLAGGDQASSGGTGMPGDRSCGFLDDRAVCIRSELRVRGMS
jgi:hypothetical protein